MADYTVAWQLEGQGRADDAIPRLKAIIAKNKSFYRAYQTLFSAYRQKKELGPAEEYFRQLIERDRKNGLAYYGLANIFAGSGQNARATEYFASCIRQSPKAYVCYVPLVESLLNQYVRPATSQELFKRIPYRPDNPALYLSLGRLYQLQGRLSEASKAIRLGLAKARSLNQPDLEAELHLLLASQTGLAGEGYLDALPHVQAAFEIFEALQDWDGCLRSNPGALYLRLGRFDQGLACFERDLDVATRHGHLRWQAAYTQDLGGYYLERGDLTRSLEYFLRERELRDALGEVASAGNALVWIGRAYRMQGETSRALDAYKLGREKAIAGGSKGIEADAFRYIANAYEETGDYIGALRYSSNSLEKYQESGIKRSVGKAFENIAMIYATLGDYRDAMYYYRQSLRCAQEDQDSRARQSVLAELGDLYVRMKKPRQALAYLTESRNLSERVRIPSLTARAMLNLGNLDAQLGEYSRALENLTGALVMARTIANGSIESQTLVELAQCYERMGDLGRAEQNFAAGLESGLRMGVTEAVVTAHLGLASVWRKSHKDLQALGQLESAIDAIEGQRNRTPSLELRVSLLERNWKAYEDAIDLLAALGQQFPGKGYDQQAFNYAERGRARAFLDALSEARAQITKGLSAEQVKQESALLTDISRVSAALMRENSERNQAELRKAERNLADWTVQLRSTNPEYHWLRYPEPYDLKRIQAVFAGRDTVLLEYALGAERSHLWVISATQAVMVNLPKRAEIEKAVREYRQTIARRPKGDQGLTAIRRQATRLYELLVQPADIRPVSSHRLVIVPDGILHFVPFETLIGRVNAKETPRYLIEDFTIAYAPSASVLTTLLDAQIKRRTGTQRELLAFGDPMFSTHQQTVNRQQHLGDLVRSVYQRGGIDFPPLPNTRVEVQRISELYAPDQRKTYLGASATEAAVKHENISEYRVVHFATHALIDEKVPARSGVVFSLVNTGEEDGILRVPEIFNLKLNADLVVLSACQTGLGTLVRGEGMVGLTRAFMYAGTPRVAVSLWEVNDLATADFMKTFYRYMKAGQSPGEALRAAKLSMIHSDVRDYHHPYFWAPFVLVGLF